MKQTKKQNLVALINELDENEKISIFNDYCEKNNYYDDMVYLTEEIDYLWEGKKPSEIIKIFGDVSMFDTYYSFDVYGAYSYSFIEDNKSWYPDEIAEYIIQNDDDLGCNEIKEYLDENTDEEN